MEVLQFILTIYGFTFNQGNDMFCPGCGIQTTEETKFCKNCGANLSSVREAMASRIERFDWSKSWLAGVPTTEEVDRLRGLTPEKKRINEIKEGVITCFVGIGVMVFLYFFFDAVARQKGGGAAEIIRQLWLVGIIPFFIGIGIIFNGLFLNKGNMMQQERPWPRLQNQIPTPDENPAKTTNQLVISDGEAHPDSNLIENTTAHLLERREPILARFVEANKPE